MCCTVLLVRHVQTLVRVGSRSGRGSFGMARARPVHSVGSGRVGPCFPIGHVRSGFFRVGLGFLALGQVFSGMVGSGFGSKNTAR
jgi:membrane-associated PAP2 superfamily phosphatase